MSDRSTIAPLATIAAKDIRDASRDRFVFIVTLFLAVGAAVALVSGAIALRTDAATYAAARETLLALGKPVDQIAAPEFYPLKLLRGAVEQIGIVGAAIAILIGYRAAASERGRQTLALILTRPIRRWQFLAGKLAAGLALLGLGLLTVLAVLAVMVHLASGVGLSAADLPRLALTWVAAWLYTACFFLVGFILTLTLRKTATALLLAFAVWLTLVLVAPQIGDTLDPDNQVAGGVFKSLGIAKPDQVEIMKQFSTYETLRDGIEQASVTKHFERFTFAVLGIKDTYTGVPLDQILIEKKGDLIWIFLTALGLGLLALFLPLNADRLTKE
ncbi:ABC transporter permease subunit [Tabrizicola sp.]|uniref:ABC transporter permease subunit n=1 Tax=Tabrizicola sp. TaxID=2005166 RepID=UPI0025E7C19D|nr:ABC transporter permease subunit [Tabrizicola sp.]MBY0352332.1 ABC transporter permease [Tabrizicola sp.]MDK2775250.1 ABC transporter permease [Tabrizicola sp.]